MGDDREVGVKVGGLASVSHGRSVTAVGINADIGIGTVRERGMRPSVRIVVRYSMICTTSLSIHLPMDI